MVQSSTTTMVIPAILAVFVVYKCAIDNGTLYSQMLCGANAQKIDIPAANPPVTSTIPSTDKKPRSPEVQPPPEAPKK